LTGGNVVSEDTDTFHHLSTIVKFAVQKPLYGIIYNVRKFVTTLYAAFVTTHTRLILICIHCSSCEHLLNLHSMQNIVSAFNTYVQSVTSQNTWSIYTFHTNRLFM